jgi:site-specific DNA-methyltransferase (adenine-specific)
LSIQLALFQDGTIKKTIIHVPIGSLRLSPFNPRRTRPKEDIEKLAERISRNGFEITRALWVCQNGTGYDVFAGGTRLEAARLAGLQEVPVVLHEGLTEEQVVRLAEEDNENDEYHAKVNSVDVWAHYAWLKEMGWRQKQIAIAKNVNPARVSERIGWHKLSVKTKEFFQQDLLTEGHLREITSNFNVESFLSSWLTTDQTQEEIAKEAARRKMTVRQTDNLVSKWKAVIEFAQECHNQLSSDYQEAFINRLADQSARSKSQVQEAFNVVLEKQLEAARQHELELARQQSKAEAERLRLEQEQEKNRQIELILKSIIHGDFAEVAPKLQPESIDVIITDPPYPEEYIDLFGLLAQQAATLLKPGGSLLVMCGQSYLPEVLNQMTPHLAYHWTLSYQTPGGQSPQMWQRKVNTFWKPVFWFVKGEYQGDWQGDVIKSDPNDNDKRYHKWGQSESGIARLVDRFSETGQTVLDPFLGGGTTGVVAIQMGRKFIGIEKSKGDFQISKDRIFTLLNEGINGA